MAKLKPYNLYNIKLKCSSKVGSCKKRRRRHRGPTVYEEILIPPTAQKHSL